MEVEEPTAVRPAPNKSTQIPKGSWSEDSFFKNWFLAPAPTVPPVQPESEDDINIVTSRPIKVVDLSGSHENTEVPEVVTIPAGTVTATWPSRTEV